MKHYKLKVQVWKTEELTLVQRKIDKDLYEVTVFCIGRNKPVFHSERKDKIKSKSDAKKFLEDLVKSTEKTFQGVMKDFYEVLRKINDEV